MRPNLVHDPVISAHLRALCGRQGLLTRRVVGICFYGDSAAPTTNEHGEVRICNISAIESSAKFDLRHFEWRFRLNET